MTSFHCVNKRKPLTSNIASQLILNVQGTHFARFKDFEIKKPTITLGDFPQQKILVKIHKETSKKGQSSNEWTCLLYDRWRYLHYDICSCRLQAIIPGEYLDGVVALLDDVLSICQADSKRLMPANPVRTTVTTRFLRKLRTSNGGRTERVWSP